VQSGSLATSLFHIIWHHVPQAFDYALMVINATAYFGISLGLMWDDFRVWMGLCSPADDLQS